MMSVCVGCVIDGLRDELNRQQRRERRDRTPNPPSWGYRMTTPRPPIQLSDIQRRQRRLMPLFILLVVVWLTSIAAVAFLARRLSDHSSFWPTLSLCLYVAASSAAFLWSIQYLNRLRGLVCPNCGTTMVFSDGTIYVRMNPDDYSRCRKCHAVLIDMEK